MLCEKSDTIIFELIWSLRLRPDVTVVYISKFHDCRNYRMLTVDREELIHRAHSWKRFDIEFEKWEAGKQ